MTILVLYPGDDSERGTNFCEISSGSLIDYCYVIEGY